MIPQKAKALPTALVSQFSKADVCEAGASRADVCRAEIAEADVFEADVSEAEISEDARG